MGRLWKRTSYAIKPYASREEILYALDTIIDSCESIIRRTAGVSKMEFFGNDDMMKASAMDMQIIGNHAGRLPEHIRSKSANLEDAYGFRCRIAHDYGGVRFEIDYLWSAVSRDVYNILDTCIAARAELLSE